MIQQPSRLDGSVRGMAERQLLESHLQGRLSMVMHAGRADRQPVLTPVEDSRRVHRGGYARTR